MCVTCGCSENALVTHTDPKTGKQTVMPRLDGQRSLAPIDNLSGLTPIAGAAAVTPPAATRQDPAPASLHSAMHGTTVALEQEILGKNQKLADRNRQWFAQQGIVALNLMSSPGSGKSTLLERTLTDLRDELSVCVVEGDQATTNDAERIMATGCPVIQINTGTGCHLEADMLEQALQQLQPEPGSLVMIENVGNLVCPALFDLGEQGKVVILSVTEGEDKPEKYPHMFRTADLMLLTKTDLLPYLNFDVARCIEHARAVNSSIQVIQVSSQSGAGMSDWYAWLRAQLHDAALRRQQNGAEASAP